MPVTSRFVQMPSRPRRTGTGGMIGSEPVAMTTCSAPWRLPSPSTKPIPAGRDLEAGRCYSRLSNTLTGVGVARNHVIAPGKRRLDIDLGCCRRPVRTVHRLSRAQQSFDGRTPSRSTRQRPARTRRMRPRPPSESAPAQYSSGAPPPMTSSSLFMTAAAYRPAPPQCTRRTSPASPHLAGRCASRARRARPTRAASRSQDQMRRQMS